MLRRARALSVAASMLASACGGVATHAPIAARLNSNEEPPEHTCPKRWERWDAYEAIQEEAVDVPDFLRRIRAELPRTCADDVRERMLFKLGHYRDPEAVPLIIEQLEAEERLVFEAAARALAKIGLPHAAPAVEPLRALLRRLEGRDDTPATRAALRVVRESLRVLGQP